MIISRENKYIFISAPKTGSQAVRDYLLKVDETASWNTFYLNKRKYQVDEHITPDELFNLIGDDYLGFRIIVFIRSPYNKAVSTYYFYRNGKALHPKGQRLVITKANIILARILPFQIWAILKPLRSNRQYLTNKTGEIIVDCIGRTEKLNQDFPILCKKLALPFDGRGVSVTNKSVYRSDQDYFANPIFKKLFDIKEKSDLTFYKDVIDMLVSK
jgi:hypothetical protein